jgi:hypothetical protein
MARTHGGPSWCRAHIGTSANRMEIGVCGNQSVSVSSLHLVEFPGEFRDRAVVSNP